MNALHRLCSAARSRCLRLKASGRVKGYGLLPAGSTIQAVRVLEEKGFRGAVTDAVITAVESPEACKIVCYKMLKTGIEEDLMEK